MLKYLTPITGEVANLVSNDCQRISEFGLYFNFAWILPVEISVVGGLLISYSYFTFFCFKFELIMFIYGKWDGLGL